MIVGVYVWIRSFAIRQEVKKYSHLNNEYKDHGEGSTIKGFGPYDEVWDFKKFIFLMNHRRISYDLDSNIRLLQ